MTRVCLLIILSSLLVAGATAQDPPPLLQTIILDVKDDKINDFVAAQKEFNAALKKAGMPQRTTWQIAVGDTSQFRITRSISSLAEYDSDSWLVKAFPDASERANWTSRIVQCVESRKVVVSRLFPEMAIPRADGKPAKHALLYITENLNGKMGEYRRILEEQLFPAYKEAGAEGIVALQRVMGGSQREFLISRGFDKWEDLNRRVNVVYPALEALGQERAGELAASMGSLLSRQERIVMTRRDDLSFASD